MRRFLVPLVLTAAAVVCAWRGLVHERPAGADTPAQAGLHPATTPVLSARRVPATLGTLVADQRLAAELTAVFADPAVTGTSSCIVVQDAGAPVYSRDAGAALIPASNLKLLTAYAILSKLGGGARLTTTVVAAQAPKGGVVAGPLYLVGGGDPLLSTAALRPSQTAWTESREPVTSLEALADAVKNAGVSRITGGVVGDDSRFDGERALPTWKSSYVTSGQIGPVGALVVDGGFVFRAGRRTLTGDPATAAAATFTALLQARGIVVGGIASRGAAPGGAVRLAGTDSPPTSVVVGEMLRESDNLAAEMLTKELGHQFGGAGTWPAGLGVIHDTLVAAGIPLAGLVQLDGSGLDVGDRATCQTLAAVTAGATPVSAAVDVALPLAGNCGTLVKRLVGHAAAGRVRAKTGTLIGVDAFSGTIGLPVAPSPPCPPAAPATAVVRPASSAPAAITFAMIVNGVRSDAVGQALEDRVADVLASYPASPVLDPFGPAR